MTSSPGLGQGQPEGLISTLHRPKSSWNPQEKQGSGLLPYLLPESQPLAASTLGGHPPLPCINLFGFPNHGCNCILFEQMP